MISVILFWLILLHYALSFSYKFATTNPSPPPILLLFYYTMHFHFLTNLQQLKTHILLTQVSFAIRTSIIVTQVQQNIFITKVVQFAQNVCMISKEEIERFTLVFDINASNGTFLKHVFRFVFIAKKRRITVV